MIKRVTVKVHVIVDAQGEFGEETNLQVVIRDSGEGWGCNSELGPGKVAGWNHIF